MSDEKLKVAPPNYTQIPNVILDNMNHMSGQCLKVLLAVCRQTFGWHKQRDRISLSQLRALTGLSQQGVLNGAEEGIYNGVLDKEAVSDNPQDGYLYSIKVAQADDENRQWTVYKNIEKEPENKVVNSVDQSTQLTASSQLSRQQVVNSVDTHKERERKVKESSTTNVVRTKPKNPQKEIPEKAKEKPQPIAVDNPVFSALRDALGIEWDSRLVTKEQRMNVTALAKSLLADGETPERVSNAAERMRQTWPWCNGERITVKSFRENYHAVLKQGNPKPRISEEERRLKAALDTPPPDYITNGSTPHFGGSL